MLSTRNDGGEVRSLVLSHNIPELEEAYWIYGERGLKHVEQSYLYNPSLHFIPFLMAGECVDHSNDEVRPDSSVALQVGFRRTAVIVICLPVFSI
jgi:hypothetical protein